MTSVKKDRSAAGIRVISEHIPHVRSISLGFWFEVGSRSENSRIMGISHLTEHMLFRGTKNRTGEQIASETDSMGAHIDALTSREYTCYYTKHLDIHFEKVFDILADMINNSLFGEKELDKEKQVVLEEIKMYEDNPEELIHDLSMQELFKDNQLGMPILGSRATVAGISRMDLADYTRLNYSPANLVITAAGNLDHAKLMECVNRYFPRHGEAGEKQANQLLPVSPGIRDIARELEQVHFCIGTRGVERDHDKRYALYILNTLLGGGISSRLFQKVREKEALVYSIYSYIASYRDTGAFIVYGGTSAKNFERVMEITLQEFRALHSDGATAAEIAKAKEQIKIGYLLGLEDTGNRMSRLAKMEMFHGTLYTANEVVAQIDGITADDVMEMASYVFDEKYYNLVSLGKLSGPQQDNIKRMMNGKA